MDPRVLKEEIVNKEEFEFTVKSGKLLEHPATIRFRVNGVTFEGRQEVLKELDEFVSQQIGDAELMLKADEDNEYDKNAVAVYVNLGKWKQAGFVPKDGAEVIKKLIKHDGYDSSFKLDWVSKGNKGNYGMQIVSVFTPKGNVVESVVY